MVRAEGLEPSWACALRILSRVILTLILRNASRSSQGSNDDKYPFEATAEEVSPGLAGRPVVRDSDGESVRAQPRTGKPTTPATTAAPAPLKKSCCVVMCS